MSDNITSTDRRAQDRALEWLQKNGGRASIRAQQVALCRALERRGLARLVRRPPPGNGWDVELVEDGA